MSFRTNPFILFLPLVLLLASPFASQAGTCTFTSPTLTCTGGPGESINNTTSPSAVVEAGPSTIAVSGQTGSVTGVKVVLHGVAALTSGVAASLQATGWLLQSPSAGSSYLEILHAVGNGFNVGQTMTNGTINLADSNANPAPNNSQDLCGDSGPANPAGDSPCASGTFNWKPTSYANFYTDSRYPSPNPPAGNPAAANTAGTLGTGTFASVFTGATLNGNWNLYFENDNSGDQVSFTSWDLILTLSVSSVSTTTTLSSSTNPSFTSSPSNSVTFTANVSATSTPTGTVSFTDGSNPITCSGGNQTLSGGVATCIAAFTTEGFHTITATYNPTGAFLTSNGSVNQWVKNHSKIVSGAYCNAGPVSVPGQQNTSPYPSIVNVGTDTTGITNSLATLTVALNGLTAAAGNLETANFLLVAPDNTHAFEFLSYVGFVSSVSANVTLTDSASGYFPQNPSSAITGTVSYLPTLYYNGPDTFNSPLTPAPAPPSSFAVAGPGGSPAKTFTTEFDGTSANGDWKLFIFDNENSPVSVTGGWCMNFTQSTGTATTTSVSGTPNGATTGATVTVTATVLAGSNPVTSGTVTFTENGVQVAGGPSSPVSVNGSGQASFTTSSLTEGDHTILATFNGNSTYSLSFGSYTERVDDATSLTISGDTFTYCNTGALTLPGPNNPSDIGQASPNPSNIFVTGLPGNVNAVKVDLKTLHMQATDDNTAALLVGPSATNADSLDFFSNTGTGAATISGNFSFVDTASGLVPSGSEPAAGTYKPTSYGSADTFFSSASSFYTLPAGPYPRAASVGTSTLNGVFAGGGGDGAWSLYFNQNTHQPSDGLTNGWCVDLTVTPPVLTVTESHTGPGAGNAFVAGQTGTYTITVGNNGPGSTGGQTVTLSDSLPTGLTQSNIAGTGWICGTSTTTTVTCTSTTAVAASGSFSPIVVTVTPALTSGASASNTATASGAGMTSGSSTTDVTTIIHEPILSVGIVDNGSPAGTFKQGSTGDTATVTVSNASAGSGAGATSSTVVVTFTLSSATAIVPASITPPGSGWTCGTPSASFTCTSTGLPALAAGGSAQFTLNFSVSTTATSPQSIAASISGGGGNSPSGTDTLTIIAGPSLSISKSHTGTFTQGGTAVWNLQVTNNSSASGSATTGTTTVTDPLPTGYALSSFSGSGWSCSGTTTVTCTSTNSVAGAGGNFPVLGLTVSVPAGSPVSVSNLGYAYGGGDPVHTALGSAASSNTDTVTVVQTPASMIANAGTTPQSATISTAFGNALAVTVKDAGSNPVLGVSVTFTAPGTGASGTFSNGTNTIAVPTNASGIASAPFTANAAAGGPYTVSAVAAGLTTVNFSLTNTAGAAASMVANAGTTPQSATISTAFGNALAVTVKDSGSNPISGVSVTFTAPGTGASGTFSNGTNTITVPTNASGIASAPFTANAAAGGPYTVSAAAAGLTTVNFSLTNTAGAAASMVANAGTTPQSAKISTVFTNALAVTVKDGGSNPVSGVNVTFTAPGTGASGTFSNGTNTITVPTNASGIASAPFTANAAAGGPYNVTAAAAGLTTANFSLTNTAGTAVSMVANAGTTPQSATIGIAFTNALAVTVKDAGSNPVSGVSVTFTAPGTGASGTFSNATNTITVTTNASGIASAPFTANLTAGGPYNVSAAAAGLTTVNFSLTNTVGAAASMVANAGTTPQSATVSTAFATALSVTIKDAGSNPVSGVSVTFTAPATGASGTFSTSTNTIAVTTNASGIASASFTANATAGGPYSVTAASAGLTTVNFSLTNTAVVSSPGPSVVSFNVLFGTQSYNVIGTPRNRLPWEVTGISVVFSEVITTANINSLGGVTTTAFSGLGTNTLTWTITPISVGNVAAVLAGTGPNAIMDASSVGLNAGAGFTQNFRVLWGDFNDDGIVNAQDGVLVNAARSQPYNIFADLNGDGVVNATDVLVARAQTGSSNP